VRSTVRWNDTWLKVAADKAMRVAALQVKARLEQTKPARSIPVKGPFFGSQVAGAARGVRSGQGSKAFIRLGGLAPIFEKGAEEHDIFPGAVKAVRHSYSKKRGKTTSVRTRRGGKQALSFGGGHPITTSVHHPGMKARPFMGPAAARFVSYYRTALARALPKPKL
jgi:hypothetical protein